ncbi:RHS repeat-associated core domain-containing protein [Pleionea sediminis]|uniref:RHS repeat-associated core domain-containing protein n=1 Tax=Pleionea sediminis TaxID=2569479 RepID=UPI001184C840|nr:RHS repeat-associated core domain-containing protein [Pleionea sediminis]
MRSLSSRLFLIVFTAIFILNGAARTPNFNDTIIPQAPGSLTFANYSDKDGNYSVSWPKPADSRYFELEVKNVSASSSSYTRAYMGVELSYTVTGQAPGTYAYRVRACSFAGCSTYRNGDHNVVVESPIPPSTPSSISYVDHADKDGNFSVKWGTSARVDYFQLFQQKNSGSFTKIYQGNAYVKTLTGLSDGLYTYRVRACNNYGCSSYKAALTMVTVDTTATGDWRTISASPIFPSANLVNPAVPAHQTTIGAVPGEGGVSGGAASYNIPIQLPPGRAGMEPNVSINYSSNSGNGLVGQGWSLSVGSRVSRCASTQAHDGRTVSVTYTSSDKYCLDGQKLIQNSDGYYYPELNPRTRVTLQGTYTNPTGFLVELPNGNQRIYGGANNSSHKAVDVNGSSLSKTRTWAINKEIDRAGNEIEYFYKNQGYGEYVIRDIYYTGFNGVKGDRRVRFLYEVRNDASFFYLAGGRVSSGTRLLRVETYVGSQAIRKYELDYNYSTTSGKSLLSTVELCAQDIHSIWQCLPKTEFQWQQGETQYRIEKIQDQEPLIWDNWPQPSALSLSSSNDYNGDGFREVNITNDKADTRYRVLFDAEGNVTNVSESELEMTLEVTYDGVSDTEYYEPPKGIDFNHDGLIDGYKYINQASDFSSGELAFTSAVFDKQTGEFVREETHPTGLVLGQPYAEGFTNPVPQLPIVMDLNGDGKLDLLHNGVDPNNANRRVLWRYLNIGSKVTEPRFDSGKIIARYPYIVQNGPRALSHWQKSRFDFDGNGIPDIFIKGINGSLNKSRILFGYVGATGSLSYVDTVIDQDLGFLDREQPTKVYNQFLDLNGDGLLDYLFVDNTDSTKSWRYKLNLGGTWGPTIDTNVTRGLEVPLVTNADKFTPKYAAAFKIGDWDNDGYLDILVPSDRVEIYCLRKDVADGGFSDIKATKEYICADQSSGTYGKSLYPSHADKDRSLYEYDQITFKPNRNGTIRVETKDLDLVLSAASKYSDMTDLNGDGITDIVVRFAKGHALSKMIGDNTVYTEGLGIYVVWGKGVNSDSTSKRGLKPDLMTKVINGFGFEDQWTYLPLTHPGLGGDKHPFYEADYDYLSGEDYKNYSQFIEGSHMVASYKKSNGVGGLNEKRYFYKGAVINHLGRGFQGFKTIVVEDKASGIRSISDFHQFFPLAGKQEETRSCLIIDDALCSTPFSKTTSDYDTVSPKTGTFISYSKEVNAYSYELDSRNIEYTHTKKAVETIDDWGNVKKQSQSTNDKFGTYLVRTWQNYNVNEASWWINKRLSKVVKHYRTTVTEGIDAGTLNKDYSVNTYFENWDTTLRKPQQIRTTHSDVTSANHTQRFVFNDHGLPIQTSTVAKVLKNDNVWEANVRRVHTGYSDDGYFVKTTTNSLGHSTTKLTRASDGQVYQATDSNGITVLNKFDAFGREKKAETTGAPSSFSRILPCSDVCDNVAFVQASFQAGSPTAYAYVDKLGRTIRTKTESLDGQWLFTMTQYNRLGQKSFESQPWLGTESSRDAMNGMSYQYDKLGRVIYKEADSADGYDTKTVYSHSGLTTDISVNNGELTLSRSYNSKKQLMETVDAENGRTRYAYDAMGNPLVIEDANGSRITASYNAAGHKLWVDDPNMGRKTFETNGFGEVEKETDANGDVLTYEYDVLGRVITRFVNGSADATFVFDTASNGKGKLAYQETGNGDYRAAFTYDTLSRPVLLTETVDGQGSFTTETIYDDNYGRVLGVVYPNDFALRYEYNDRGYQTKTVNAVSGYVYEEVTELDQFGNLVAAQWSSGKIDISAAYDSADGQMKYLGAEVNNAKPYEVEYDYGSFGNLMYHTVHYERSGIALSRQESFQYDKLHRLERVSNPSLTVNYNFDAVGNLTLKTDMAGNNTLQYGTESRGTRNAGPNALLRAYNKTKSTWENYSYDNNGNRISGGGKSIVYNAHNKPTNITQSGVSIAFDYGPDLLRFRQRKEVGTQSTETLYLSGGAYERVETENNNTRESTNVRISIGDVAVLKFSDHRTRGKYATIGYTVRDRLGSVRAVLNHNGTVTEFRSYDAFGKPRNGDFTLAAKPWISALSIMNSDGPITPRGFTDHENLDEVELIHMNGRMYDFNTGRFLSVDPFVQAPDNSQSMNPYSYIMNNPLAGTDPSGYRSLCDVKSQLSCPSGEKNSNKSNQVETEGENGAVEWVGPDANTGQSETKEVIQTTAGHDLQESDDLRSKFTISKLELTLAELQELHDYMYENSVNGMYADSWGFTYFDENGNIYKSQSRAEISGAIEPVTPVLDLVGGGTLKVSITAAKSAIIRKPTSSVTKKGSTALRPVGQILESVDDVMANPRLLKGINPAQLMSRIKISDKWVVGKMKKTRSEDKGFTLREMNKRGTDYTDRYIQYHPGSRRHFGGKPYWKVSSGNGGTDRFPVKGD